MSALEDNIIHFRPMTEADLDEVMRLETAAHVAPWTRGIFLDCIRVGYYCPLLVSDKEILAYAVMSVVAGEAHIFNICVNKEFQHQGYGRKMMLHLLEVARKKNAKSAFLEVRPSNRIAINLYESVGFLEVGHRKSYYPGANGEREDALIMAIELTVE